MSPLSNYPKPLQDFLSNQTIAETIQTLDDVLQVLVIHTEYAGLSEGFVGQYLTIRELRDMFGKLEG